MKPFLVFGLPRSGTSLFSRLIGAYFEQQFGHPNLGEYFNPNGLIYQFHEQRICPTEPEFFAKGFNAQMQKEVLERKFQFLRNSTQAYFMKVQPLFGSPEIFEWLEASYEWIFVERADVFQHFLSYCISHSTDRWYEPGGLRIPAGSIHFRPADAKSFMHRLALYRELKARLRPSRIVIYEEFLSDPNPTRLLKELGFTEGLESYRIPPIPARQNPTDKLPLFRSPSEVLTAFHESIGS